MMEKVDQPNQLLNRTWTTELEHPNQPKMDGFRNKKIANSAVLARKFEQNLVSNEFISVKMTP